MKIGRWHIGFSRNFAVGVIWTTTGGGISFLFLGLSLTRLRRAA